MCKNCKEITIPSGIPGPAGLPGPEGWKLDGNDNGSEKYIGTNDNFDLSFRVNNIERFKIYTHMDFAFGNTSNASGNLNIFTVNNGGSGIQILSNNNSNYVGSFKNINGYGEIDLRDSVLGGNPIVRLTASGNPSYIINGNFGLGLNGATAKFHIKTGDATSSNYAVKVDNVANSPLFNVRNDGNVGIGTASPTAKLQVQGTHTVSGNYSINVRRTSDNFDLFGIDDYLPRVNIGASYTSNPASLNLGNYYAQQRYINFGDNGESGRFYTASGGLRCEFSNPQNRVDINLSSDNGTLTYNNSYVTAAFRYNVQIGIDPTSPYDYNNTIRLNVKGYSSTSTDYAAKYVNSSDAELLSIRNDGNIGINTDAPTSKLQVVGLPSYANNAAAISGGLTAGAFYIRIGHGLDVVV